MVGVELLLYRGDDGREASRRGVWEVAEIELRTDLGGRSRCASWYISSCVSRIVLAAWPKRPCAIGPRTLSTAALA